MNNFQGHINELTPALLKEDSASKDNFGAIPVYIFQNNHSKPLDQNDAKDALQIAEFKEVDLDDDFGLLDEKSGPVLAHMEKNLYVDESNQANVVATIYQRMINAAVGDKIYKYMYDLRQKFLKHRNLQHKNINDIERGLHLSIDSATLSPNVSRLNVQERGWIETNFPGFKRFNAIFGINKHLLDLQLMVKRQELVLVKSKKIVCEDFLTEKIATFKSKSDMINTFKEKISALLFGKNKNDLCSKVWGNVYEKTCGIMHIETFSMNKSLEIASAVENKIGKRGKTLINPSPVYSNNRPQHSIMYWNREEYFKNLMKSYAYALDAHGQMGIQSVKKAKKFFISELNWDHLKNDLSAKIKGLQKEQISYELDIEVIESLLDKRYKAIESSSLLQPYQMGILFFSKNLSGESILDSWINHYLSAKENYRFSYLLPVMRKFLDRGLSITHLRLLYKKIHRESQSFDGPSGWELVMLGYIYRSAVGITPALKEVLDISVKYGEYNTKRKIHVAKNTTFKLYVSFLLKVLSQDANAAKENLMTYYDYIRKKDSNFWWFIKGELKSKVETVADKIDNNTIIHALNKKNKCQMVSASQLTDVNDCVGQYYDKLVMSADNSLIGLRKNKKATLQKLQAQSDKIRALKKEIERLKSEKNNNNSINHQNSSSYNNSQPSDNSDEELSEDIDFSHRLR